MFERGQVVHLMVPGEAQGRHLHRGVVEEVAADRVACSFEDKMFALNLGSEVVLYSSHNGKFLQCGGELSVITDVNDKEIYNFTLAGEAHSAETRESFRILIVTEEIFATVADYPRSRLVDISAEGFGIVLKAMLSPGVSLPVTIHSGEDSYSGRARVQTAKELDNGTFRYGMLVYESGSPLRKGLTKITNDIQRARLKRISRVA